MNTLCPKPVFASPTTCSIRSSFYFLVAALLALVITTPARSAELTPYSATYTSEIYGLSLTMQQTLRTDENRRWQLKNDSGVPFVNVEESTDVIINDATVYPRQYEYINSLSEKRSAHLRFNWLKHLVTGTARGPTTIPADTHLWDPLSFQIQLRLDLINGDNVEEKSYPQIARTRIKEYRVHREGEERLKTELGTFETIKLRKQRQGRDEYSLIWLAREWDYMIVRLQRIEEGEITYQIDLRDVSFDRRELAAP